MKRTLSLRITEQARTLLVELSKKLGISQTAVVELAIRRLAEIEHVEVSEVKHDDKS